MENRKQKSIGVRLLGMLCSFLILGSIGFMVFAGIQIVASSIIVVALLGAAVPGISSGDGFMEIFTGIFEVIFEGFAMVLEAIGDFFSSFSP